MASPILNPNLRGFFESNHRYYVLYGGRSSGKTYHTAGFCVFLASQYKVKFLCVRQFQARISDSVKSTIEECIDLCGMRDEFKITENSIEHKYTGSTFSFLGINRNLNEIKGLSGIEVLWIEEAEALTKEQWRVIMPTVRAEGSKIFIVFNPRLSTDFVYQNFVINPPEGAIVRKINYDENPYLSNTMRKVIEDAQNDEDFSHIYLGEPRTTDDESIIQRKHIMAAIDAHIKLGITPAGATKIGYDVADAGEDSCATVSFKGALATDLDLWKAKEDELLKSCSRVHARARQEQALIVYDAIGVGASCGAKFNELNAQSTQRKVLHQKFFAGGAPAKPDRQYKQTGISNRDFFSNIKAQAWWITADRFMNTYNAVTNGQQFPESDMIFIDSKIPHLEQLIDELVTPKRDYDLAGRVKVESKKDLSKRDIKSPNCFIAGTLVMTDKGNVPIESLQIGDNVFTPMGLSKIIYLHKNETETVITKFGLTGTPNHKIFTWNKGWNDMQTLSSCDIIESFEKGIFKWQIMNALHTKAKCFQFSTQVDIIAQDGMAGKMLEMKDFYTAEYGQTITGKFLIITTSTISMVIGKIIELKILSVFLIQIIKDNICLKDLKMKITKFKTKLILMLQDKKQMNGINQKTGKNGILNTLNNNLKNGFLKNIFARFAEKNSYQEKQQHQLLAQENAQQKTQILKQSLNFLQIANNAEMNLTIQSQEKAEKENIVQHHVQSSSKKITVYNITLEKHNVYYANDILVKNCADAFVMVSGNMDAAPMQINPNILR